MAPTMNIDEEAQRIMAAAHGTVMLSAEEEANLARAMRRGDQRAKAKLLEAHQPLVIKIAKSYGRCGKPLSDLIQEGNVGMVVAAGKFNPDREGAARFATFASWHIWQTVKLAALDTGMTMRIPPARVKEIAKLRRTVADLSAGERAPTDAEVAASLGVTIERVRRLQVIAQYPVFLNAPVGDENETEVGAMIADPRVQPADESFDKAALTGKLTEALSTLTDRERDVLLHRFGVLEQMTLEELGDKYKVSRERIRQIEKMALAKLKKSPHARLLRQFIAD